MFTKVLVPLDGSPLAAAVLTWVRRLVAKEGSRVYLLHVIPEAEPVTMFDGMALVPVPSLDTVEPGAIEAEARRYLAGAAERLGPTADVHPLVRTGKPAPEIVAAARECGADLIAMSTHGRTGLPRLVLGSVADEVVRVSGLPVVLLHPEAAVEDGAPA